MPNLLNPHRPPVFCPGCAHDQALHTLDRAFDKMNLNAGDIAIVSDIGCSGLLDTFFSTHAFHGLHGRALTYAAGIKLAQPHLNVVVTMGDGGLGIGGAHLLAACRRNLDLTLLILNNFNFGMTGGQFSCTTPSQATVSSSFLNTMEKPMDVCSVAATAGAPFVARSSVYDKGLSKLLVEAVSFEGFSLVDIWGICPARYLKKNPLTPQTIDTGIKELPPFNGPIPDNLRKEYGSHYREKSGTDVPKVEWWGIEAVFTPPVKTRREIVLLGAAGQRILSTGSLLAHAAILAGMHITQKNEYNITVMRGPSITELILSPDPIHFTGVEEPDVILALSQEGVSRRLDLFGKMKREGVVISAKGVDIPSVDTHVWEVDFDAHGIRKAERALAALSLLAGHGDPITLEMLESAVRSTFHGKMLEGSLDVLERAAKIESTYRDRL